MFQLQRIWPYFKNCLTQKNKGQLRINGLSAKSLACGLCQVPHKVEEGKNKGKFKTRLSACDQFRSLSVNERAQVLADVEGCIKCTDWQHSSKNCDAVYGKRKWQPCSVKEGNGSPKCGKDHPWADPGFWIGGGHVLTSGRSVVDMGPKTLYNVGRLGGAMAPWPPPWIRP